MADYNPFPEVSPSGAPLSIPTDAGMFGGGSAEALGNVGKNVQLLAQQLDLNIFAKRALANEVYANDANTQVMKKVTNAYSEYEKFKGRSAQERLPAFQQTLEDIKSEALDSLPNPETKAQASRAIDYTLGSYYKTSRSHADTEFASWQDESTKNAAGEMAAQAQIFNQNPTQMETYLDGSDDQVRKLYEQQHYDTDTTEAAVKQNRSANYKNIISFVADGGDPSRAQDMFEAFGKDMTAGDRLAITGKLKAFEQDQQAASLAQSIVHPMMKARSAIAGIESGGHYGIVGPKLDSGDRAYGKYQVMGTNVGPWTRDALGKELTPDEFLHDPDAQDKVFDFVFGQYVQKYGSVADAASMWFTGKPAAEGAEKSDVFGTTGASYVQQFMDNYEHGVGASGSPEVQRADAITQAISRTGDRPDLQAKVLSYVSKLYDAQDAQIADFNRQQEMQDKLQTKASDTMEVQVLSELDKPDGNVNLQEVYDNPILKRDAKERIRAYVQGQETGAKASMITKKNTMDMFNKISSGEVTDTMAIAQGFGKGDYTRTDYDWLIKTFNDKKTPDGQNLDSRESEFVRSVTSSITGRNDLIGIPDPEGDANLYKFKWELDQKIAAYRKEGKNPYDLLDPSKPEYVGKPEALAPYQNSLQDRIKKRTEGLTSAVKPTEPTGSNALGEVVGSAARNIPVIGLGLTGLGMFSDPISPASLPPAGPKRLEGESIDQYDARVGAGTKEDPGLIAYRNSLATQGIVGKDQDKLIDVYKRLQATPKKEGESDSEWLARVKPLSMINNKEFKGLSLQGQLAAMESLIA